MATAKKKDKVTTVSLARAYFAKSKKPMAITHEGLQKGIKKKMHVSIFYKVKREFRTGDSKHNGAGSKNDASDNGVQRRAAPGSKMKKAVQDKKFMEYLMWMNVGLREGFFDLYVTANTTDMTQLREAFDHAQGTTPQGG